MNYTIVEEGNWQLAINPVDSYKKAKKEIKILQKNNPKKHYWIALI